MGDKIDGSASQQVTLENSTHHQLLVEGLSNHFSMQHAVDFELLEGVGDADGLRAHKLILEIFLSPSKLRAQHHQHERQLVANLHILHTVLEFLYRGRVTVLEDSLPKLLEYAREVDFKLLAETVESVTTAKQDSTAGSGGGSTTMLVNRNNGSDDQTWKFEMEDVGVQSAATTTSRIAHVPDGTGNDPPAATTPDSRDDNQNDGGSDGRWKFHIADDFAEPKDKMMSLAMQDESCDNEEVCTPVHLVSTSMEPEQSDTSRATSDSQHYKHESDSAVDMEEDSGVVKTGASGSGCRRSSRQRQSPRQPIRVPAKIRTRNSEDGEVVQDEASCAAIQQGPLEFIKSAHGNRLLTVSGFLFSKERDVGVKTFWRCVESRAFKCPGRCHTVAERLVKFTANHNHVPDVGKIGARRVMHEVKERALSSGDAIQQLLDDATAGADPAYTARLPAATLMRRTLQRARNQYQYQCSQSGREVPSNPASPRDLVLPASFQETLTGEPFLLFDSGAGVERILLFATATNMKLLAGCATWYCDGTFRAAPPLFENLYTVHAVSSPGVVLPCVFALLPGRTQNTFVRLLSALNRLQDGMRPSSVVTGFDEAASHALRQIYPGVVLRGCFFHLGQCVWRQVRIIEGMAVRYSADPDFALQVRLLAALAYVPVAHVVDAFEALKVTPYYLRERRTLQPLLDFFEDTFVGRSDIRSAPVHPVSMWNCYEWLDQGSPLTSNAVDAWHRGFDKRVGADRRSGPLSVWKFLSNLKQEQAANQGRIEQLVGGSGGEPEGRRKYRDATKQLFKVVEEYEQRGLIDYLTAIANNLSLSV